jgi:hypothetical protein
VDQQEGFGIERPSREGLDFMQRNLWLLYVALAGLSWGTYVPLIFYGGNELGGKPASRLLAILCVGIAYFVIGVIFPAIYLLRLPAKDRPEWTFNGLLFSALAGAAGALGAICVIFATKEAFAAAKAAELADPGTYKLYIAPLIFGLAPVINTLVSIFWHPKKAHALHFGFAPPHPLLWVGIVCVGLGAALVLYSKEIGESRPAAAATEQQTTQPSLSEAVLSGYTGSNPWLLYVTLAGLCWGTYVPLIFYGGSELGGKPSSRLGAILCVGVAYFLLGVVYPGVYLSMTPGEAQPDWGSITGLTFASLAGAAGAIGAICVIFATKSAIESAKASGLPPATYKLFIAPLIFGLAPVINTLVSIFWHPKTGSPLQFGLTMPHWTLWVGILGVGTGAALVLYSKELAESAAPAKPAPAPQPQSQPAQGGV